MKSKEKKEYEEALDFEKDSKEDTDEYMSADMQLGKNYPSGANPQEFYAWKTWRSNPDAVADFPGMIDKDVDFAKLSGSLPSIQELNFLAVTINMFKSVFIDDADADDVEAFTPVVQILLSDYKFRLVSSRAHGNDREAVLDNITSIKKEYSKKKDTDGKTFGLGGR